jgi:Uma2 family endonuclease
MVIKAAEKRYYTPEEYLEFEVASDERHEYVDGAIVLKVGGTPDHSQIAGNLCSAINLTLKRQPYRVFIADQRIWIPQKRLYTYPDIFVVQGELEYKQGDRIHLPIPF